VNHDVSSSRGDDTHDGGADAARPAGNDDDFVGEIDHAANVARRFRLRHLAAAVW
jgi:hypothetical protein